MTPKKPGYPNYDVAEELAINALSFLASQPEALGRFLRLTGIGPANLRQAAAEPGFLAGLLDYFLANEDVLVEYAREAAVTPEDVVLARQVLAGERPRQGP
jgi:hypothetical protein